MLLLLLLILLRLRLPQCQVLLVLIWLLFLLRAVHRRQPLFKRCFAPLSGVDHFLECRFQCCFLIKQLGHCCVVGICCISRRRWYGRQRVEQAATKHALPTK